MRKTFGPLQERLLRAHVLTPNSNEKPQNPCPPRLPSPFQPAYVGRTIKSMEAFRTPPEPDCCTCWQT